MSTQTAGTMAQTSTYSTQFSTKKCQPEDKIRLLSLMKLPCNIPTPMLLRALRKNKDDLQTVGAEETETPNDSVKPEEFALPISWIKSCSKGRDEDENDDKCEELRSTSEESNATVGISWCPRILHVNVELDLSRRSSSEEFTPLTVSCDLIEESSWTGKPFVTHGAGSPSMSASQRETSYPSEPEDLCPPEPLVTVDSVSFTEEDKQVTVLPEDPESFLSPPSTKKSKMSSENEENEISETEEEGDVAVDDIEYTLKLYRCRLCLKFFFSQDEFLQHFEDLHGFRPQFDFQLNRPQGNKDSQKGNGGELLYARTEEYEKALGHEIPNKCLEDEDSEIQDSDDSSEDISQSSEVSDTFSSSSEEEDSSEGNEDSGSDFFEEELKGMDLNSSIYSSSDEEQRERK